MDDSKTYCAAAWRHLQLRTDRTYGPCCAWHDSDDNGFPDDSLDPINHPWMDALRDQMLSGVPQVGCGFCYMHEEMIGKSMRLDFNDKFGRVLDPRLDYVEINFGSLCNLVCRMCGPKHSSRWAAVGLRMGHAERPAEILERQVSDIGIDFNTVTRIKFIGGEPLMHQPKIREILSSIMVNRGSLEHLEVEIITNGTIMLDADIVQMLQGCREVLMLISMDGLGDANAYQRHGSDWEGTVAIARDYDGLASETWQNRISATISVFTVHQARDFHEWMRSTLPNTRMITNLVVDPVELSPRNLPQAYKDRLLAMLDAWETPLWHHNAARHRDLVSGLLRSEPNCSLAQMRHYISRLDGAIGTDLRRCLPDVWADIFED